MPDKPHALLPQAQGVQERLDRRGPLALDRGGLEQVPQRRVVQRRAVHRREDRREPHADKAVAAGPPKLRCPKP